MEDEDKEIIVRNFEFFDSDDEEEIDFKLDLDDYESPDEETEDYLDILKNLLKDVADVDTVGLKVYKIDFYNKNIGKLESKNCDCDFDEDEDGMPILPDGGEEFIIPYLYEVSQKIDFFEDCIFETNIGKKITI